MLFPEEEKIIVEETKSNGQTVIEERLELYTLISPFTFHHVRLTSQQSFVIILFGCPLQESGGYGLCLEG